MTQDLLQELLDDPDRHNFDGAGQVIAYDPHQDEPAFLDSINADAAKKVRLIRRGIDHGHYALLEAKEGQADSLEDLTKSWRSARPIVLRGRFESLIEHSDAGIDLYDRLKDEAALQGWLGGAELPRGISLADSDTPLDDADRDLSKVYLEDEGSAEGRAWVKLGKLSTHPDDDSLRVRIGFGREREDDASPLLERQRLVSEIGRKVLPGMDGLCCDESLSELLGDLLRGPSLLSQPLAYWNRPGGGALFHHDAFGENSPNGQRGVLYVQISGETLWIALSINDLAKRVREMTDAITLGDLPELREHLYPNDGLQPLLPILAHDDLLREELGKPGCGQLSSLVNYGPSFTAWLADSGHACILGPGDAILLPNHGVHHTCMHSVFCVSDRTTYALSTAIRLDAELTSGND